MFTQQYTKDDCIESLEEAAEKLGKSPTVDEYKSLDISPSYRTIRRLHGSWNKALVESDIDINESRAYTKDDCIESLKEASEKLGKSPTQKEYSKLDFTPRQTTIKNTFGSWNEAKSAAGLQVNNSRPILSKPTIVDMSQNEWVDLETHKRVYLRRRVRLTRIKLEEGCSRCGIKKLGVLEFHHTNEDEKSFTISSKYLSGQENWKSVKEEIKKCEVICSNCHSLETKTDYLSV